MYAILSAFLLVSAPAWAKPPAAILAAVERAYSPAISDQITDAGFSLGGCAMRRIQLFGKDPVDHRTSVVRASVYEPVRDRSPAPRTVLLFPPMGGENTIDRGYANRLCGEDFRVVLVQGWTHDVEAELDLGAYDKGALRMLVASRRLLDYIHPQRAGQVGVLGTSVGAIEGSTLLGYDKRVSAGVFVVGGVGLPDIVAQSDLEMLSKLRFERTQRFGFRSVEEYAAALRENVHFDPGAFAGYSGKKPVLAFVATKDTTVPTKNQFDLVQAFGALSELVGLDHVQAILHVYTFRGGEVEAFFSRHLR